MDYLTGQEVVSAVAKDIRAQFSTTEFIAIYKDAPDEGFKKPCVYINSIDTDQTPMMRNIADRLYQIEIRCHPEPKNKEVQTWARSIAERLAICVSRVTVRGSLIKARSSSWRVQDNVLSFVTSFPLRVFWDNSDEGPEGDKMLNLDYGVYIVEDGEGSELTNA